MIRFVQWLVQSSVNPDKIALTMKGILSAFVPLFLIFLKVAGIDIAQEDIEEGLVLATSIFSGLLTLAGLARKLWYTFKKPST